MPIYRGHVFDRFAICEAHYVFAVLWHDGQCSQTYRFLGRLMAIGFKPSVSAQYGKLSSPEARAAYRNLCLKHGV